jgi:hypothetical protein
MVRFSVMGLKGPTIPIPNWFSNGLDPFGQHGCQKGPTIPIPDRFLNGKRLFRQIYVVRFHEVGIQMVHNSIARFWLK